MPLVFNALESQYYFDNLRLISQSEEGSEAEKVGQLYPLFISIINSLSETEDKQVFTGWFAKVNFVCQAYGLDAHWEEELQGLRRFFRRTAFDPKFRPKEADYWGAIKLIAELIAYFADSEVLPSLQESYASKKCNSLGWHSESDDEMEALHFVIQSKGEFYTHANGIQAVDLEVDSEEKGKLRITVQDIHYYNQKGQVFRKYELSRHCVYLSLAFQTIRLTHLQKFNEEHYGSTDLSLMIASPDYLVDASAVARCFGSQYKSPYLYLLDQLKFFQGNIHTFRGSLVNYLLDNLFEKGDKAFGEALRDILPTILVEAAMLGLKTEELREISRQIEVQYHTLRQVAKQYEKRVVSTEPSYISPTFGLQGRLDLLVEYPEQENRKDIVELKSTKFPNIQLSIARRDHLIQVACYNLLLDSTYPKRSGNSAILYAQDSLHPLRNCGKLDFETQDALWARNCMVYIDLKMAEGESIFYDQSFQKLRNQDFPFYIKTEVENILSRWENAPALEKEYFSAFMGLIAREMLVAKVGGGVGQEPNVGYSGLWRNSIHDKRELFNLLSPLKILSVSQSGNELRLARSQESPSVTTFRAGDIVVFYPLGANGEHIPTRQQLLKGSIIEINEREISLKIWSPSISEEYYHGYSDWALEPSLMDSSYRNLYASLSEFLNFRADRKAVFLGLKEPAFKANFSLEDRSSLSKEQNEILKRALSAEDYFILQGPPGTGKTSGMLRSMVDYLYHESEETLVLLAFTNRATDEICEKIKAASEQNFIRLGNLNKDHPFWQYSLKNIESLEDAHRKIQNCRIFVSTVSSFYTYLHLIPSWDTIIVDEASQLLEPHLCGILPRFRRFILIGDEKQLPAVVSQSTEYCEVESSELRALGIRSLSTSVFERLLLNAQANDWTAAYAMLTTQYRSHKDITQFINTYFYKKLKTGSPRQKESLAFYDLQSKDPLEAKLGKSRLLFIPSRREANFKFHQQEAERCIQIATCIRKAFEKRGTFTEQTLGIITPYRAQIAEIYRLMEDELREKVSVDTVERYQGSERDIIIISLAINHPRQMLHLESFDVDKKVDKKLNVAMSRAREQVIVLANPEYMKVGKFYRELLSFVEEIKI